MSVSQQKTIVVLSDYISFVSEGYEGRLRQIFHDECRKRNLNLLLFYGRALEESSAPSNSIFELIDPNRVHGVIVLSSLLSATCGADTFATFARRYASLPACSAGIAVPGLPSIEIDNRQGMDALLEHLITDHGYRRLAFIGGYVDHPEAKTRFMVYREVLARHGIEYDPRLVAYGNFVKHRGYSAMEEILSRGVALDAVVCANDTMAAGATDALRKQGHRVPGDLAVTGFDDLVYARLGNPPLTTVAQPLEAMGELALRLVLDQLAGKEVPLHTALPAKLRIRASCGCLGDMKLARTIDLTRSEDDALDHLLRHRGELCVRLAGMGADPERGALEAERIVHAFEQELKGQPDSVLGAIEDILESIGNDGERYRALHDGVALLRVELQDLAMPALNALFHEVDRRILVSVTTVLFNQRVKLDYNYMQLVGAGERVSVSFELNSLEGVFHQYLPVLGVRTAFLSRYHEESRAQLEPFVRIMDGELCNSPAFPFPARELFPPGVYPRDQGHTYAIFPLVFKTECLGVAIFEYAEGIIGYQMLCDQASAALQSVLLHREVVHKTMLHERSVQERLAATQRMQALRVLAGGVAHDLNNALGPLLALPDIMLRQLEDLSLPSGAAGELRADVESIKSAALHAAQTIKDLLTLSRQGRTPKSPMDLNGAVQSCLGADPKRFLPHVSPTVKLVLELHPEPLVVVASEAHLMRALLNLVHNAVEAMPGEGEVVIRTTLSCFKEPHSGYESVPPGEYAVVTVSDNGSGVPVEALTRLFEPFFSTKAVRDHSGTGLGLAIVHGVVKEHEGFIDVVSSPGEGTTFALYFPRSEEAALVLDPTPSHRQGKAKILIVDDDPTQLRTGVRVLKYYGYEVHTLASGQEAAQVLERAARTGGETPYDLVILDMHLGGEQDGLAILARIRAELPEQKALMVSGHAPDERVEVAVQEGIPWLAKPYSADALASAVRGALSGQPSIPVIRVSSRPP